MAEQVNSAIAVLDWIDSLPSKPVRISRIDKHRALTADFQEVPFETFIICDNLYQGYLSAKEDALLDDLARQFYKSSKVTPTEAERIGVFYCFASLKEMFARQFKHFFKPISNAGDADGNNSIGNFETVFLGNSEAPLAGNSGWRGFDFGSVILLGFEPKTHSLEGCCSIQLSYRTIL